MIFDAQQIHCNILQYSQGPQQMKPGACRMLFLAAGLLATTQVKLLNFGRNKGRVAGYLFSY